MQKEKEKKNRRRGEKRKISWKRLGFYCLCFLFLLILIYVFIYSNLVKIAQVEIKGNKSVNSTEISDKINFQISSQNWLKISRQNFFLVSEIKFKNLILENFPKIKNVEVKKVFPDKLKITLEEYDLIPVVCLKNQESDQCFVLENDGKIVEKADFNSQKLQQNEKVIIIDKNENDIVEIGKEFIDPEKLANIIFLGNELTFILNTKIEQPYFIPARGADEAKFVTKDGWYILVDTTNNPKTTFKVLNLFFEEEYKGKKHQNLEYIDVRMNEKIFYKVKEEDKKKEDEVEKSEKDK